MNRENIIDGRGKKQCRINPGDAAAEETVVSEIKLKKFSSMFRMKREEKRR